ncbi:hypothetical protein [Kibdelosporangium phytohabitans]|uniref:hypothetical protein n=1 Tax=Kibdelosporangium phytohabitans TaxID=860235 RepID=UPI0012FB2309|nr:hypothetical protein [Kibdelosporangium phytohabitans]MBE1467297.1 hypothetical protein [Kibdelosporangium phytohabitans]
MSTGSALVVAISDDVDFGAAGKAAPPAGVRATRGARFGTVLTWSSCRDHE